MLKKNSLCLAVSLSAFLIAGAALARTSSSYSSHAVNNNLQQFQLKPQFNLWGFTGNRTFGKAQMRLPIFGDENKVFYGIVQGDVAGSDSSWLGSAGLGYRQIIGNHIYGGYLLTDYQNSASNNGFWIANPGLEMLGNVWDLNANFYIPISAKQSRSKVDWADNFGNYDYASFTGHNEYDAKLKQYEEVGRGLSLEVGRTIPHFSKAKAYLGGYHFDTNHSGSINGIAGKVTYDLNKYATLELADTYDNTHHNTALIGIRINFGNYSSQDKEKFGLSSRLLDPVEEIHSARMAVPIATKYAKVGYGQEHDNIWFFKPQTATSASSQNAQSQGNGTYEDPFIGFHKNNYGAVLNNKNSGSIDQYPLLYFASGNYNFQDFSHYNRDNCFNLPNGWGMYGRSNNYRTPALGAQRPTFTGGLDLVYDFNAGSAATTLDSIRIVNNRAAIPGKTGSNAALYAKNAGNVILKNVAIENNVIAPKNSDGSVFYVFGIYAEDSTLNFMQLNPQQVGSNSVSVVANGQAGVTPFLDYEYGIAAFGSAINFLSGNNNISAYNNYVNSQSTYAAGIYADQGTLNFFGGNNKVSAFVYNHNDQTKYSTYGYGIYGDQSTINFLAGNNNLSGTAYSYLSGAGHGMRVDNKSTINFRGGNNKLSGSGASFNYQPHQFNNSYGIVADHKSVINFFGGHNNIIASGAVSYADNNNLGIFVVDDSTLNFYGGINNISAQGASYKDSTNQGLLAFLSTVNFYGGQNTINAIGSVTTDNGNLSSKGIGATGALVNFYGGVNKINALNLTNTSGESYAAGIYMLNEGVVNFAGGSTTINVSDKGSDAKVVGIHAFLDSEIQVDGKDIQSFSPLNKYVNFIHQAGEQGYKIEWWKKSHDQDLIVDW